MLLTGNYRCVLKEGARPIREAVHGDIDKSRGIYAFVDELTRRLGADSADQVPFEKYASAAESLLRASLPEVAGDGARFFNPDLPEQLESSW